MSHLEHSSSSLELPCSSKLIVSNKSTRWLRRNWHHRAGFDVYWVVSRVASQAKLSFDPEKVAKLTVIRRLRKRDQRGRIVSNVGIIRFLTRGVDDSIDDGGPLIIRSDNPTAAGRLFGDFDPCQSAGMLFELIGLAENRAKHVTVLTHPPSWESGWRVFRPSDHLINDESFQHFEEIV